MQKFRLCIKKSLGKHGSHQVVAVAGVPRVVGNKQLKGAIKIECERKLNDPTTPTTDSLGKQPVSSKQKK